MINLQIQTSMLTVKRRLDIWYQNSFHYKKEKITFSKQSKAFIIICSLYKVNALSIILEKSFSNIKQTIIFRKHNTPGYSKGLDE